MSYEITSRLDKINSELHSISGKIDSNGGGDWFIPTILIICTMMFLSWNTPEDDAMKRIRTEAKYAEMISAYDHISEGASEWVSMSGCGQSILSGANGLVEAGVAQCRGNDRKHAVECRTVKELMR